MQSTSSSFLLYSLGEREVRRRPDDHSETRYHDEFRIDDDSRTFKDQFGRDLTREQYLRQREEGREHEMNRRKKIIDENKAASPQNSGSRDQDKTKSLPVVVQQVKAEEIEEEDVLKSLGFTGFGSTKGKKVEDNHSGAARGAKGRIYERTYRQYMNRPGGFNRPLDPAKDSKGNITRRKKYNRRGKSGDSGQGQFKR